MNLESLKIPKVGDYIIVDNSSFKELRGGVVHSMYYDGSGCTYGEKINKSGDVVPMATMFGFITKIYTKETNPEYFL